MPKLTVKQKEFCRLIASGKCKDQSDAYRKAYKTKAKPSSIKVNASKLMDQANIRLTIKELSEPIDVKVRKTRDDLVDLFQAGGWFDPRKMFDTHGNPSDIPALPDHEAMMLEGFEIVEEFSGKGADRVPVGYTRKFKLGDRHKYATSFGKMMGYITDEPQEDDSKPRRSINVTFVSAHGNSMQITIGADGKRRLVDSNTVDVTPKPVGTVAKELGVKFVSGNARR